MDDVDANKYADKWSMAPVVFANAQGQNTVVPMGQTFSVFFYRSDLVKPEEVPKTLEELVTVSKKLQADGKVKFGYVGGMSMNNTWFSWFWSMWGNNCDVLLPAYERDNKKLAENGWKSGLTEPCMQQTAEYWWDAINTPQDCAARHAGYDRKRSNAVFMSGDAASPSPTRCGGQVNDPANRRSPQGGAARFPLDPTAPGLSRGTISGLGIRSRSRRSARSRQSRCAAMDARRGRADELWRRPGAAPNTRSAEDRRSKDPFDEAAEGSGARRPQGARRLLLPGNGPRCTSTSTLTPMSPRPSNWQARRISHKWLATDGALAAAARPRQCQSNPPRGEIAADGYASHRNQSLGGKCSDPHSAKLNKHYGLLFHAVKDVDLEIADKGCSWRWSARPLRQVDDAAHDGGVEDISAAISDRQPDRQQPGPPRDRDVAMVSSQNLRASTRHMQRCYEQSRPLACAQEGRGSRHQGGDRSRPGMLGLHELFAAQAKTVVGRPAAARGARPLHLAQSAVFLFRRAAVEPRRQTARQMRIEIKALHAKFRTTSVFVTTTSRGHTLLATGFDHARRRIQQIARRSRFRQPANKLSAGFIGAPAMNLSTSPGALSRSDGGRKPRVSD